MDKLTPEQSTELNTTFQNLMLGDRLPLDVCNAQTDEVIIPAGRRITKTLIKNFVKQYDNFEIDPSPIRNKFRLIIGEFERKHGLNK